MTNDTAREPRDFVKLRRDRIKPVVWINDITPVTIDEHWLGPGQVTVSNAAKAVIVGNPSASCTKPCCPSFVLGLAGRDDPAAVLRMRQRIERQPSLVDQDA